VIWKRRRCPNERYVVGDFFFDSNPIESSVGIHHWFEVGWRFHVDWMNVRVYNFRFVRTLEFIFVLDVLL
jgi:hypothetical protein